MKRSRCAALILILVLASGISVFAKTTDSSSAGKLMDAISKAIDEGELDPSMEKLDSIQKEGLSDETLSRLHFLQGKVVYIKVSKDIQSCRAEGTQKRNELQEHQIDPLVIALEHMKKSYELSSDSDWTPEVLYAAGLIQDSSCLQRFGPAMESYRILMEKYPDSNLGKAARKKYHYLKSIMDKKGHGQAHP